MTGSYNNNFMIYPSDPEKETEVVLQADKSAFKAKKIGVPTPINSSTSPTANGGKKGGSRAGSPAGGAQRMRKETDADQIDFNKKILHMSWHPFEDSIAIAATNNVSARLTGIVCSVLQANYASALCLLGTLDYSGGIERYSGHLAALKWGEVSGPAAMAKGRLDLTFAELGTLPYKQTKFGNTAMIHPGAMKGGANLIQYASSRVARRRL